MKKSTLKTLVFILTLIFLVGCGKSKEQKKAEKELKEAFGDDLSDENIEELAKLFVGEEDSGATSSAEQEKPLTMEEKIAKMQKFPLDANWNTVTQYEAAFQIDDVFIYLGMPMNEVMNNFANSACDYSYEYNPDYLVPANQQEFLYIEKEELGWITIMFTNPTDSPIPLKDTIYSKCDISSYAYPFVAVLGKSTEELSEMSYDDIHSMESSLPESLIMEDYPASTGDYIIVEVKSSPFIENQKVENTDLYSYTHYAFYIEKNTNTCFGAADCSVLQ